MSDVYECPICIHFYDADAREPLCLPCGHTSCKTCLLRTICSPPKLCPICRTSWQGSVEDLPVIYQLIPDHGAHEREREPQPPPQGDQGRESRCHTHGFGFEFWCQSCYRELCKKCLIDQHKYCTTLLVQDMVSDSNTLKARAVATYLKKNLTADLAAVEAAITKNLDSRAAVNRLLNILSAVHADLAAEHSFLVRLKADMKNLEKDVGSHPFVVTAEQKLQLLQWATHYHAHLKPTQPVGRFSYAQIQKLAELCAFAKSYQFPPRQQQQQKGWFGRWL